ncbi:MAG TPA: polysaccharide deacetylase family protein [Candidatus Binatia bacterium]|jgi:peptidoglycan/xylan/chitin deacetylase (PgdA/CDA1 family)
MSLTLPILTFHDIADASSVISFSPQVFRQGIAQLYESGYRTLSLIDAAKCLGVREPFPDRSVIITFDDGYRSVYEEAFPVLQQYGMSATVFLTVGERNSVNLEGSLPSLEGRSMLSWRSIREMQKSGIVFGAHTMTHPDLTCLPMDEAKQEILLSKNIIEEALGIGVSTFAYPYGRYNALVRDVVRDNFACACSDRMGLAKIGSDPYTLERVDSYYLRSDRLFSLTRKRVFPWYIRARSLPRSMRRFFQTSKKAHVEAYPVTEE